MSEKKTKLVPHKEALDRLKAGNHKFVTEGKLTERNLKQEVAAGADGQTPFATVLSCIDSRMPAEMIFDQGIGDIFSIRIAGNFVNKDILGSMEFACNVSTTRLLVVMGHTSCGAIKGACAGVELGNLTQMLDKLMPAVKAVEERHPNLKKEDPTKFANLVSVENVKLTLANIVAEDGSPVLKKMLDNEGDEQLRIMGAMYDISTGEVTFYDDEA